MTAADAAMRTSRWWGIGRPDVLLTAVLFAVPSLAAFLLPSSWLDGRRLDVLGAALIVLATLPVLVRRRQPVLALAACIAVQVVYHVANYPHDVMLPVMVVLIYTVSLATSRLSSLLVVGSAGLMVVLVVGLTEAGPPGPEVLSPLGWFTVALVGGQAMRLHRALQDETIERRVAEERLRIARDLHDGLAHHIVVINSHAGVAAHLLDERADDPSLGPISESLHTVADASSGVLAELRTTLDVLRGNEADADRRPTPDLKGLAQLTAVTEVAGVEVDLQVRGTRLPLPAAVEITLYRIAQEALTNVVKHAQARRARVLLDYRNGQVMLEVTDDGQGVAESGGIGGQGRGYGIVGMTERAHAVGGLLETGNGPAGGFRVAVTVPTGEA